MSLEEVRVATFENNLLWLDTFGCRIQRRGELVRVTHESLSEYNTLLVLGAGEDTLRSLRPLLASASVPVWARDIYVDSQAEAHELRRLFDAARYRPHATSLTTASIWSNSRATTTQVSLLAVSRQEIDEWSAVYSRGFGRSPNEAEIDRTRWARALAARKELAFWFLARGDQKIGTCQTCTAKGVVGLYSFSILPPYRGVAAMRDVTRALGGLVARVAGRAGEAVIYFERARTKRDLPRVSPGLPRVNRFAVIRQWTRYERLPTPDLHVGAGS